MSRKIEDLANAVRDRDTEIAQLKAALAIRNSDNSNNTIDTPPANPPLENFFAMMQQQMLQMNDNFQQSIKALVATQITTQTKLQQIEAAMKTSGRSPPVPAPQRPLSQRPKATSAPLQVATGSKKIINTFTEKPSTKSSVGKKIVTTAYVPTSETKTAEPGTPTAKTPVTVSSPVTPRNSLDFNLVEVIDVTSDRSTSPGNASDRTITPDFSPNPNARVDTPLPITNTPKSSKRPSNVLSPPIRPLHITQPPMIPKSLRLSPEPPDTV
ncbi:uncharacterized protein LOC135709606 [Ochlerotatus camptorhynchus]